MLAFCQSTKRFICYLNFIILYLLRTMTFTMNYANPIIYPRYKSLKTLSKSIHNSSFNYTHQPQKLREDKS